MRSLMAFATRNLPRTPGPTPSVRKVGPDFHLVQLTAEGKAHAAGTPLRISNGRISIVFPGDGTPVKVARYEWDMLLRDHAHVDGSRLFAIVTEEPQAPEPEVLREDPTFEDADDAIEENE